MISRAHMRRQLRGKGGITNVTPRTNYFLGGIKDRIRKIIPNELANVASKAAPFVAPFSPKTAALMRGIGRFDQRGSISDALKQGAATYGFGKGVRYLGGAEGPSGGLGSYSKEGFKQGPIGKLFQGGDTTKTKNLKDADDTRKGVDIIQRGTDATIGKVPVLRKLPDIVKQQLFVGGITSGATALYEYFKGGFRPQEEGETIEEYLAERKKSVGTQMRTYMDNYFKFDKEYSTMTDAERDAFVARYNVRDGGMPTGIMRTNKAGVMERDYRDKGGFVPVGVKEKADDVPAMLSKNEFVMTANAVRGAGNGSIEKGAQRMYDTMKRLEKRAV
jgi:hypothetical protein